MLEPGTTLEGRYALGEPLGEGGMATVYAARHLVLDLPVAIKVLDPVLARKPEIRRRFLDEARTLARFQHRGVVRVTDTVVDTDLGVAGFVMELLDGRTLRAELEDAGQIDAEQAVALVAELLDALQYCHRRDVVHRDVKPSNVFVAGGEQDWRVKLMDFGIARLADSKKTRTGATLGTSGYMSPEQIVSPRTVDPRSDIFSAGTLLYELVAGSHPFEQDTDFATAQRIVAVEFDDPRDLDIPDGLAATIERALRKDPSERFATAGEMAETLRQGHFTAPLTPRAAPLGDRIQALIDKLLRPIGEERLYFAPEIPAAKLAGARKGLLKGLENGETVYALYDDTLWGGCKDGFALTDQRFHYKDLWEPIGAVPYADIDRARVEEMGASSKIQVNGTITAAMTVTGDRARLADALADLLRRAGKSARKP